MVAPSVAVILPYQADNTAWRAHALDYVTGWWRRQYPRWQLTVGELPAGAPWVKANAVDAALSKVGDADVLVIADADVVCDGVGEAVVKVGAALGRDRLYPWAVPHHDVLRLSEPATARVLHERLPLADAAALPLARPAYRGVEGGGIIVVPTSAYRAVPLDPRFVGWNNEDTAWALAARTLLGKPWRSRSRPLYHLWHPPAPRLNSHVGDTAGHALHVRYQYAAKTGPDAMRQLIDEHTGGDAWPAL